MKFNSAITDRGGFFCNFDQDEVKNEPMFFNCDIDFAHQHGGPITREFIENLPMDWLNDNPVLDSRVHMLMPNWYPCIPGWHHDDVPRSTPTGQPNYINPEYDSLHIMGMVNGEICPTTFIVGDVEVSEPNINVRQYNIWNNEIENDWNEKGYQAVEAQSGRYIQFDRNAFHTGIKAKRGGWRWFIRLSRNTDRMNHITNEIRRQVQVYLEEPMAGW